jgi:hypothetical protein
MESVVIELRLTETCSKVYVRKHLSDARPVHSGLKGESALSPLLFNLALECH